MAGLIVILAIYRNTRKLSFWSESSFRRPQAFFIYEAIWNVRRNDSPTRPIACESDVTIEMTPKSCRIFSAACVSGRTRLSAKATSEGICGLRLWHTIIISNNSACELIPKGSVGFVDEGKTKGIEATFNKSGA